MELATIVGLILGFVGGWCLRKNWEIYKKKRSQQTN